jgi:hypothetical protein
VLVHLRPLFRWFDHSLDPPQGDDLWGSVPDHRAGGVPAKYPESPLPKMRHLDPHGGDAPSVPSEDITPPCAPTDPFASLSGLSPTSV